LRSDELRRPDPGKHAIDREEVKAWIVHGIAVRHVPIEIVVPHRDDREGLTPGPGIEEAGLLMPPFGVAPVEVIDHEEELGAGGLEAELRHQRGADIAADIDVGKFERADQLESIAVIDDEEAVAAPSGPKIR
jgi:hypothetical protein